MGNSSSTTKPPIPTTNCREEFQPRSCSLGLVSGSPVFEQMLASMLPGTDENEATVPCLKGVSHPNWFHGNARSCASGWPCPKTTFGQ